MCNSLVESGIPVPDMNNCDSLSNALMAIKVLLRTFKSKPQLLHNLRTVQPLCNTPHYNNDLDITWSWCGSKIFLPWNFTKDYREMIIK